MNQKIEIIISPSRIISETIEANLGSSENSLTLWIEKETSHHTINNQKKIDLLVIDDYLTPTFLLYHIKTVINLTPFEIIKNEIKLHKPFRLNQFLEIIKEKRKRKLIFCSVNNEWLYDEQLNILFNKQTQIKFTEKENEVFKALLFTNNNELSKGEILQTIWEYHPYSESGTIETHLYRLKNKLPENMLQIKENFFKLIITNII